jgi:hypothetical protein
VPALQFGDLLALLPKTEILIEIRIGVDCAGKLTCGEEPIRISKGHHPGDHGLNIADPALLPRANA